MHLSKKSSLIKAKKVLQHAKKQVVGADRLNSLKAQLSPKRQKSDTKRVSPPQEQLNNLLEHYQSGRFNDAEKLALAITSEFPKQQFAWNVLAAVLNHLGRISESLVAVEKAVKLAPNDAARHYNLGIVLQELGRLDEAEASHNRAIALKPEYAKAHNNLGIVLQELGRLDEAEASYNLTIAFEPEYAEAHSNLGNTLKELGRLDEAIVSYNQTIVLKPEYAEAHNNLGIVLQEQEGWTKRKPLIT